MKKKDSQDSQKVADLLKKLQASYLGEEEKAANRKKKEQADEDDKKFQEKLAAMLGNASSPAKKTKKRRDVLPVMAHTEEQEPELPEAEPKTANVVTSEEPFEKEKAEEPIDTPQKEKKPKKSGKPQRSASEAPDASTVPEAIEEPPAELTEDLPNSDVKKMLGRVESPAKKPEEEVAALNEQSPVSTHPLDKVIPLSAPDGDHNAPEDPIGEEFAAETVAEEIPTEPSSEKSIDKEPLHAETALRASQLEEKAAIPTPKITIAPPSRPQAAPVKPTSTPQKEPLKLPQKPGPVTQTEQPRPSSEEPIVIKPKETVPKTASVFPPPKTTEQPIRIVPNVTVPSPSNAPDFAKERSTRDPNTIVIRPPVREIQKPESIVIRPRVADKPKPAPQIKPTETAAPPIKIGKEVKTDIQGNTVPTVSETQKTSMKKESNVTFVPPTPISEVPIKGPHGTTERPKMPAKTVEKEKAPQNESPTAEKKHSVTLPRGSAKKQTSPTAQPKIQKRKTRRVINSIPVTMLTDDDLEEVLDEDLTTDTLVEEIPMDEPEEITPQPQKLSIFQRRQQQKQKQAEEKLSALEVIRKRSGLSEDDIAMMFELGYENELGRLVGYENLKRLKTEHLKRVSQNNHRHYRTAYGYRGEEFADTKQRESVTAAYQHDRKQLLVRLCFTALLSLLLLFIDMPHRIGSRLNEFDAAYPILFPIMGILLLALTASLSWRQINAGLHRFFKFEPTPYTVPALLLPFSIVYDLVSLFGNAEMLHVNFLVSLSFLVITVCDVLRVCCEMRALKILSVSTPKTVLAPAVPRKKKLRQGDKIVKIMNDDIGENRYQVRVSEETVGFFRRFNAMDSASRPFTVMICTMLILATLVAFADAVCSSSLFSALSTFMTVLLLGAPLSACVGFFYPLSRANRLLARRNCTLVGEEAVEEFDCPKTVIFRDTDLYTAEKCTEISVREGDDFRGDLRLAGILFRKLGGTMETVGQSAPVTTKNDPPVSVVRIQETGVEAVVDNRYHMLAGNAEFLKRGGVRVPRESTDKALRRTANISLMYVAIDGVLKLSYEIEYRTKPLFEDLIRDLADTNSTVAIYSYDPNLSDAFLQKSRSENAETVRTVKPGRFEEDKPLNIVDTGAVALGNSTDIVYPLHAATGIGNIRRFGLRMQLIATLLGALSVAILSILGQGGLFGVLPILTYQCFWIFVTVAATYSELNAEKLHLH